MFNKLVLSATAVALFATTATAICPGYDFGITEIGSNDNANKPVDGVWNVVDGSCNIVDQVTSQKPCTVGVFDCNPAANAFTGLYLDGIHYACQPDNNAGSCSDHNVQFCCRHDDVKQPSPSQPHNPQ